MAKKKEEMVTISKEVYEQLLENSRKLECLECCGVDNWGGYDDAMNMLGEEE